MFQVEICSQQLEICKSVCMLIVLGINFRLFCSDDCRSWPREEKLNNHGCFVSTYTFLTMIIEESVCFMSCEPLFFAIILIWYTRNIYIYIFIFFINRTVHMSYNILDRVLLLGHVHIICITVWENRIICCQLFNWFTWHETHRVLNNHC
jgi:hypothetical protein